jgi:hypothetical protein
MCRFAWLALAALAWGCAQGDVGDLPPDGSAACEGDPSTPEECNGKDDDCDGVIDDGFPNVGVVCTVGEGACESPGKTVCDPNGGPGATTCVGDPGSTHPELCGNGADDDCDGLLDEGFADHGMPCTVGVGACARSGKLRCSDDMVTLVCDNPPAPPGDELCGNAADDDCDGATDEGFELLLSPCDGADADLCTEGMWLCSGDGRALVCSDPNDVDVDVCNTLDDDCNADTPDGAEDPGFNVDCDGGDADLCKEGKTVCNSATGALVCGDPNDADPEVCDGLDNDCNAGTADGVQDTRYGIGCDGNDADICNEGVYTVCTGGVIQCNDPNNDNNTNDASNCGTCGTVCSNPHGSTSCVASACDPNCDFGWQACGALKDGCGSNRDTNQGCTTTNYIGEVDGDQGNEDIVVSGIYNEGYYRATVREDSGGSEDPTVRVELYSPPGVNFGLCVRCDNCSGAERCNNAGGAGGRDFVDMQANDDFIVDDDFDISIRIYYISGDDTSCGGWTLVVTGNVSTSVGDICDG